MFKFPALCSECGRTFDSRMVSGLSPSNVSTAVIGGNTESCPYCGGVAYMLDARIDSEGRLQFVQRFYHILTNSGAVNQDLEHLQARLESIWSKGMDEEQVIAALEVEEQKFPGLVDIYRYFLRVAEVAGKVDDVRSLLSIMRAVIGIVMVSGVVSQMQRSEATTTPMETPVIVQSSPTATITSTPSATPTFSQHTKLRAVLKTAISPRQQRKLTRANTPCPCGSGMLRKECHGAKR